MYFPVLFFIAAAPSLMLMGYFFYRDRQRLSPKRMIVRTFLVGLLATLPAVSLELILTQGQKMLALSQLSGLIVNSFAIVGFSEEFFKMTVVIFVVYTRKQFVQAMDGMRYAVLASLGFAAMENFLYGLLGGVGLAVWRYFTALPMHVLTAGIMGYYLGLAKSASSHLQETKNVLSGLTYAIVIHGLYNLVVMSKVETKAVAAIGIIAILTVSSVIFQSKYKLAAFVSATLVSDDK